MAVDKISSAASITFRSLEGLSTLVSQQREGLLKLKLNLAQLFNASCIDEEAGHPVNEEN